MRVKLAQSDRELEMITPVLLQLRPDFTPEVLVERIRLQQREQGYRIAYVASGRSVLCVAGFVIGWKLAWGKHVYVDDLVTDESRRSNGAGGLMIQWLKEFARETGCREIHLDSGVQRFRAHRFYLREGFRLSSHHFSLEGLLLETPRAPGP